jgi:hypothetical protein
MRKLLITFCFLSIAARVQALETTTYDATCVSKSESTPLRQTIVIVDESAVATGPNSDRENLRWKRPLLDIADATENVGHGNLTPHEHIIVYLARKNGAEIAPVFVGCSPNISEAERHKLEENDSTIGNWFTGGTAKIIATARSSFKDRLADAIGVISRAAAEPAGAKELPGSLLRSIVSSPRLFELSVGIPRIVFISALNLIENPVWPTAAAAREAGFDLGQQSSLDLHRAEVYVVALQGASNQNLRLFFEAFLLRSRGQLVGWRSDGISQLLAPPVDLRVFGGTFQMGDVAAPVQVRISLDSQGNLVNSWIEITTGRSLATPIIGKAICQTSDACEIKGGQILSQAWNPDQSANPVFNPKFAWSGLRFFEMSLKGKVGAIRIWDPKAKVQMGDRKNEDFQFSVDRTNGQLF